jgi:hypothetical protein
MSHNTERPQAPVSATPVVARAPVSSRCTSMRASVPPTPTPTMSPWCASARRDS